MSLKLASLNAQEGLAQPPDMPVLLQHIDQLDADVMVLPDAYSLTNPKHGSCVEVLEEAVAKLASLGYSIAMTDYGPDDQWHHDRNMMVVHRCMGTFGMVQEATRRTLDGMVLDPATNTWVRVSAYHGDDRGPQARLGQTQAFVDSLIPGYPVVRAGDYNEMHHQDPIARRLGSRAARATARAIPPIGPLRRVSSLATRSTDMTEGEAITLLESHGLVDADPSHTPTFRKAGLRLPLDRIMYLKDAGMRVEGFTVGEPISASNHQDISVLLLT